MTIDKKTNIKLETTANYQPLSNLNVQFYNRDINTSVLNFIVTRNNSPLLLGDANVDTSIILVAEDGSKIRDELAITDGMNGIIQYTIPSEFLKHTGKVTGQVEIAIKGKENTVVERLFSFNIAESLVESFGADTKLVYIKKFDDLEIRIDNQMTKIEEAMANGTDYVTELEKARAKGLSDIDIAKTNSLEELSTLANTKLEEIELKGDEYVNGLNTAKNDIDTKINQFNDDVLAGGYLKSTETETWQKYGFTLDDGKRKWLGTLEVKIETLPPGLYEATIPYDNASVGVPPDSNGDSYIASFDIFESSNGLKQIRFTQNFHNRHYIKTIHSNGNDRGWREFITAENTKDIETTIGAQRKIDEAIKTLNEAIDLKLYDTGWQDIPLMSGFQADSIGPSKYRIKNDVCTIIFNAKITSNLLSNGSPMFSLPSNYSPKYAFSFLARTNGNSGKNPIKGSYDEVNQVFKIWEDNSNTAAIGNFIYGQLTFIVG